MKRVIYLLAILLLFASCGTTKILTSSGEGNLVVSGVNKGLGATKITRTGVPKKVTVYTEVQGVKYGETIIKRKFDWVTLLVGLNTYGIGFITCWRFPSTVIIQVPSVIQENKGAPIWSLPPRVWGGPSNAEN